jgi:putative transposase
MYTISRFRELLNLFPRGVFDRAVRRREADKYRKGFSCWQQLVVMVYGQLTRASSLRVLLRGFNAQKHHHYHLGCSSVQRSTLADANAKDVCGVFREAAEALMLQVSRRVRAEGSELLQLLDSTSITAKGRGFDAWSLANRTRNTQGIKLHVLFDPHAQAPIAHSITAPNVNDIDYARTLPLERDVIYVFDKGYCDYGWWWRIEQRGARFVTRLKRNAKVQCLEPRKVPRDSRKLILKDELIRLSNRNPGAGRHNPYTKPLRRIEVARQGKEPLVLVTNDLKSAALRIAQHYQARWQIELFFKWIKQHLRIKHFYGRSENAVRIQILAALIAYLLVALHHRKRQIKTTLWLHLSELTATLFQRPSYEHERYRRWRDQRTQRELMQAQLFA